MKAKEGKGALLQEAVPAESGAQMIKREKRAQFQSRGPSPNFSCFLVVPVTHSPHHHQQEAAQVCACRRLKGGHEVTQEDMRVPNSPTGHPSPPIPYSEQWTWKPHSLGKLPPRTAIGTEG